MVRARLERREEGRVKWGGGGGGGLAIGCGGLGRPNEWAASPPI